MEVGIDIEKINRFENMLNDENRLNKIFTKNEINYFNKFTNKLEHIAGCFCAKEAFVKALKIGFTSKIKPLDVEILHDNNNSPFINLISKDNFKEFNISKINLSISHCDEMATAICIIE